MTANDSSTEESGLTPKQEQLIAALVAGNSIVLSAAAVGIGEKTAHRWLKLPHFQEAYKSAKRWAFDESLEALRNEVDTAINTVRSIMQDSSIDPAVRLRAATVWLSQSIQVHKMEDLAAQVQELTAEFKASRV